MDSEIPVAVCWAVMYRAKEKDSIIRTFILYFNNQYYIAPFL